jgi:hypothetical protein
MLAKLLAMENITVIHAGTRTASFDPKRRILSLPIWKEMGGDLYDLLVLHEIAHALYTPSGSKFLVDACNIVDAKYPKVAKRFINIVEDARIERLIKVTYPGGRGSFIRGYNELLVRNFFGTNGQDINDFGIIDRINIYFKTGNTDIKFSAEEMVFIRAIENVLTFNEVVGICEGLYKYAKAERNKKKAEEEEDSEPADEKGSGEEKLVSDDRISGSSMDDKEDDDESDVDVDPDADDDSEDLPDDDDGESDKSDKVDADKTGEENEDKDAAGEGVDEDTDDKEANSDEKSDKDTKNQKASQTPKAEAPEVNDDPVESVTDKAWGEKQEELCDDNARPIRYLGIPKPRLQEIIVPYQKVHSDIRKHYLKYSEKDNHTFITNHEMEFVRFKDENKPVVEWLIKEFEMRKAADQYARTLPSKTGILDMNKLNQYQFADDIMKKVTSVVGGKNHALKIFVDWSGSMSAHRLGTIHQLINIALFCRKEQIPFDAYLFGAETHHSHESAFHSRVHGNTDMFNFEIDDFGFYCGFSLRQILSGTMTASEFNDACVNLLMLSSSSGVGLPEKYKMGVTPLNETIVAAIEMVDQLRKKTNIQIVNIVFITDGEATTDGRYIRNEFGETSFIDYGKEDIILRDPVTHIDYTLNEIKMDTTKVFLQILRSRTKINTVGFFICGGDKAGQAATIATMCPERWAKGEFEQNKIEKELEENNYILGPNMGYTEFYIIPGGRSLCISYHGSPLTSLMGNGQMVTTMSQHGSKQRKQRIVLTRFIKLIS